MVALLWSRLALLAAFVSLLVLCVWTERRMRQ
jgi:hypothetical protein